MQIEKNDVSEENNVIDIMEYKLLKKYRTADTDLEAELADTLLEMYQTGMVDAMMIDGELMFQSAEIFGDDEPVGVLWNPEEIVLP